MTNIKHQPITLPEDWDSFAEWASSEADGCISVGGLARRIDGILLPEAEASQPHETPCMFGLFLAYARRDRGWSIEKLAVKADVDVEELIAIEGDPGETPTPRIVYQLSETFNYPFGKLQELAGLAEARDDKVEQAAYTLKFAAQSNPSVKLSKIELQAFELVVKILFEKEG